MSIEVMDLEHGAIYELNNGRHVRCNVSRDGDEYWLTNKQGVESSLTARDISRKVKNIDDSFKNNDM